jgi:hypothetical protein
MSVSHGSESDTGLSVGDASVASGAVTFEGGAPHALRHSMAALVANEWMTSAGLPRNASNPSRTLR